MKLLVKIRDLSRAKWLCSNDRVWEPEEASRQAQWQRLLCIPNISCECGSGLQRCQEVGLPCFFSEFDFYRKTITEKGFCTLLANLLCNIHDLRCPGLNPVTYLCDLGHTIILCRLKSKIICYSAVFIRVWLICQEI